MIASTLTVSTLSQMLFHVKEFRGGVYTLPCLGQVLSESTTLAMQSVFFKLQVSSTVGGRGGEQRGYMWDGWCDVIWCGMLYVGMCGECCLVSSRVIYKTY